jgi:glutamyl-tRNA reductase
MILLIGLNHRTAPVEIREQLAFSRDGVATALLLFRNQFPGAEAAIISTCNRVEILVAGDGDRPTVNDVLTFIAQARDLPVSQFKTYLYTLSGEQACRHFFRVAAGLDSRVLGESQIVSQDKPADALASEQGLTGRTLNRLFHQAFEVGKRIRTETRIGEGKILSLYTHLTLPTN